MLCCVLQYTILHNLIILLAKWHSQKCHYTHQNPVFPLHLRTKSNSTLKLCKNLITQGIKTPNRCGLYIFLNSSSIFFKNMMRSGEMQWIEILSKLDIILVRRDVLDADTLIYKTGKGSWLNSTCQY